MKLSIDTPAYNDKRHGKPWIATVDFSASKQGVFCFSDWIGQAGEKGLLELDTTPGQIVAMGQKDNRKPKGSAPEYFIVQKDGELKPISKVDAYKAFQKP